MKGSGQAAAINPERLPGGEPGYRSTIPGGDTWQMTRLPQGPPSAKFLYAGQAKRDLSNGPCLSESLPGLSDWAVDIAHDPRQAVDDQPANQCQSYRDGETHHFVELTPDGQLIRAQ